MERAKSLATLRFFWQNKIRILNRIGNGSSCVRFRELAGHSSAHAPTVFARSRSSQQSLSCKDLLAKRLHFGVCVSVNDGRRMRLFGRFRAMRVR